MNSEQLHTEQETLLLVDDDENIGALIASVLAQTLAESSPSGIDPGAGASAWSDVITKVSPRWRAAA